ncbi:MAG: succinate dehydrogenase assembly factor 2 [Alphaproteobacteria bacterium]|nr:succinate dehydrogenase assembly factor 2 [Alphaproteobacteria bacterium]
MDDALENLRKRLIFRSGHRGTKEMDLIMGSFAKAYVPGFSQEELAAYEDLLGNNDPDLYNWITGKEPVPDSLQSPMMNQLLAHKLV